MGGWLLALVVQLLGGIALAGLYMPGLRSIVPAGGSTELANGQGTDKSRAEGGGRARTVAWYTSSFTMGASLSFLFAGRVAELVGWRSALVSAGICAVAALAIAAVAMPSGTASSAGAPTRLMDLPAVLRNRQVMAFMIG